MNDIPPDVKDGDVLAPWLVNAILAELRRWRRLQAAPPLFVDGAREGTPVVWLSEEPLAGIAVVTSAVGPGSATAPGSGTVAFKAFDGTGYVDTGLTGTVYNSVNKTVGPGDVIQWKLVDGVPFVDVPGNCADLT